MNTTIAYDGPHAYIAYQHPAWGWGAMISTNNLAGVSLAMLETLPDVPAHVIDAMRQAVHTGDLPTLDDLVQDSNPDARLAALRVDRRLAAKLLDDPDEYIRAYANEVTL